MSRKSSRYEIRLAGSGGQGIILAAIILAEAALLNGYYVAQSQRYGPETRGGTSTADVIVSNAEIDYPLTVSLDLLICLGQEAYNCNIAELKEEGFVIIDPDLVKGISWAKVVALHFDQIAQHYGDPRATNMAALGAVCALYSDISRDSVAEIIAKRLPSAKVEVNLTAFNEAFKQALKLKADLKNLEPADELEI